MSDYIIGLVFPEKEKTGVDNTAPVIEKEITETETQKETETEKKTPKTRKATKR